MARGAVGSRVAVGIALLALAATACTRGADAPVGQVPEVVPTVDAVAEPTEEPLALSVQEAQEILDELARLEGDVFRLMIAFADDHPAVYERLESYATGEHLRHGQETLPQFVEHDPELVALHGGDPLREVLAVEAASDSCVSVRTKADSSEVIADVHPWFTLVVLVPADRNEYNDTGWKVADELILDNEDDLAGDPCTFGD